MKTKLGAVVLALVLMLAMIPVVGAQAPAYQTAFTTSITYQNVESETSDVTIDFYPEGDGTPITIERPALPGNAGASIFVGSVEGIDPQFRGSAVLSSSRRIVATLVQVPVNNNAVKNRPLSNGFDGSQGSTEFLVPTTLKGAFNTNTIFSVQNVDSAATNVTVEFYDAVAPNAGNLVYTTPSTNLPMGTAKYYDLATFADTDLPDGFNGSAIVKSTSGNVVASAMELSVVAGEASAFEGVPQGGTEVFMATALCQRFGGTSAYAVQNTADVAATVSVTYKRDGQPDITHTQTIQPGAKFSFNGCAAQAMPAGSTGSAVINSDQPVVAIGKVFGATTTAAYSTAFAGANSGASSIALPYVRWSQSQYSTGARQRTFIAIQNVGDAATGPVTVSYRNSSGAEVCSHTIASIAPGAKANSNPYVNSDAACAEFGFNADGSTGGSAVVSTASGELIAIARVQSVNGAGQDVAEDYNGTPIQ